MTGRTWHQASMRKCAMCFSILTQILRAGTTLPGGITKHEQLSKIAWELMDQAEATLNDDSVWAQLPTSARINNVDAEHAREELRYWVECSK
jgi:hypothetical protein